MSVDCSRPSDKYELMEKNLERVINWVNNCDQKASILLTLLGVVVTIVCTSDVFDNFYNIVIAPFLTYVRTGIGYFSFYRTLIAILSFISILSIALSLIYLLATLSPKIDYDKLRKTESEMLEKSNIFFGSIANTKYNDFNLSYESYFEDLRSQVYVNSLICKNKFDNYAKALKWIFILFSSVFLSFLLISFF